MEKKEKAKKPGFMDNLKGIFCCSKKEPPQPKENSRPPEPQARRG
jgi:hypothetical protein